MRTLIATSAVLLAGLVLVAGIRAEEIKSGPEKRIGGAALDVFPREPLPSDSPLWDVPNLLITPHTAALTEKLWERHYTLFAENLRHYLSGEPLVAVVYKKKGY